MANSPIDPNNVATPVGLPLEEAKKAFMLFGTEVMNGINYTSGIVKDVLEDTALYSTDASISLKSLPNINFNIVDDYSWTSTPKSNRYDIPYIHLTEYEQDVSSLYAQLGYWGENLKTKEAGMANPYKNLYHAKPTDTTYKFPYFENYDHTIAQNWVKTKGIAEISAADKLLNLFGNIGKFAKIAPGTTVNQPREWSGVGEASYSVRFLLFNTIPPESKNIQLNHNLKFRLQMSTLHNQMGPIMSSPPAIYEVKIPGIRYSPAAVISNLSINNIGQMNLMYVGGLACNIPDAYEFNITITELISESRQILNSSQTELYAKVKAIADYDVNAKEATNIINSAIINTTVKEPQ